MSTSEKSFAIAIMLGFVIATLAPLSFDDDRDSFPLSPYRMFARKRHSALRLDYVIATPTKNIDTEDRRYLSPRFFGSSEVLQARATIAAAVRKGRKEQLKLCHGAALRLASETRAFKYIHLIRGAHDSIEFLGEHKRGTEKIIASCPIEPAS